MLKYILIYLKGIFIMAEPYSYLKQYYEAFDQFKIVSKTDPKGYITYANLNFAKISGYYREELLGKKHNIVRHPDMDKKVFENMWKTILSGHVWRGEVKNKRKDGSAYWTKSDIIPIFKDDIIVEFVSIREDITEKKLMELKLKKDSIFKKELFEALPNVSMLIHQEKGLVMCNNQFFKEFNVSSSEEFNKNYVILHS
jgi:PAS domain S-box-containing protein